MGRSSFLNKILFPAFSTFYLIFLSAVKDGIVTPPSDIIHTPPPEHIRVSRKDSGCSVTDENSSTNSYYKVSSDSHHGSPLRSPLHGKLPDVVTKGHGGNPLPPGSDSVSLMSSTNSSSAGSSTNDKFQKGDHNVSIAKRSSLKWKSKQQDLDDGSLIISKPTNLSTEC